MKEALHAALSEPGEVEARRRLRKCIEWFQRSRLQPFVKLSRTLRRYFDGIMAYVTTGLSNGRAEGTNGKIRVITKRAYGFHHVQSLIALIGLCCSKVGQSLRPPVWKPLSSSAVA